MKVSILISIFFPIQHRRLWIFRQAPYCLTFLTIRQLTYPKTERLQVLVYKLVPKKTLSHFRYIATQGPLAGTSIDFWYMIWECQSSLINFVFRDFSIRHLDKKKARKEKSSTDDVTSCDEEVEECDDDDEVRHVTQMAYLSWPDHGVPENPGEFIQFVETVRLHRQGSIYPTIVHCSAGIGRTGMTFYFNIKFKAVEVALVI